MQQVRQVTARPGRHLQEGNKATPHRVVERSQAVFILGVHIDAEFDQRGDDILVAGAYRQMQRRTAACALQEMALGHQVHVGPGQRQQVR